ncbi:uncharacterized protein LOC119680542 [Teleopsis dalmanni]|uniref:uncharacterized protein LOC119680542 n=1 Tax=Teleopsis dalmanni TaxID=139649 RepID=UPI0018CFC98D|nr:uncharacterized protein LOC119680542 [Teleopsis dalmanni]
MYFLKKKGSIPNNVNSNLNQLNSLDSPPAVEEHETAQLAHNNASNNSTNEQYLTQVLVVNDTKIDAPTLPANVEPIARIVSNGNEIRSVIMAHCNVTAPIAREEEANCVCATENIENGNVDNAVKRSKSRVRNYLKKCKDRLTGHCNQSTNLESITESIPTTVTTTTAAITTTATTTTNATVNTITDTITAYSPPVVQALGTICERSVECLAEMNLTSLDAADEDECSYDDINFSLTSSITMTGNEINPDNCDNVTLSELNCDTSIRDERLARMLQLKPNVSDLIDKHLSHIYPVYFEYTREVLIRQACDVLISSFDGNLEQFEEDFLLRYTEIASKLKEKHTIGEAAIYISGLIVAGDELWIYAYEPETKQQSIVWFFEDEPNPTKVVRGRSTSKQMVACFFGKTGHVATVPFEQRRTVTSEWYTTCLPEVFGEIRKTNERRQIIVHYDNENSHTSAQTSAFLSG